MGKRKSMIFGLVLAAAGGVTQAQIYESKDAEGNTVYSDTASQGAKKVDLQEANIVDSVAPAPGEEEADAPVEATPPQESAWRAPDPDASRDDVIVIGDQSIHRRPEDTGDNPRHEVLNAKPRAEQGSAVPRHERGN